MYALAAPLDTDADPGVHSPGNIFAGMDWAAGTTFDQAAFTASEALAKAGLDWGVAKRPLYVNLAGRVAKDQHEHDVLVPTPPRMVPVPGRTALVRDDTNAVLGVVGKDFTPWQPREQAEFIEALAGSDQATIEAAGSLYGGGRVWFLAKLHREIYLGNDRDEAIAPYLLSCNGHDGGWAARIDVTPLRIRCANALTLAIKGALRTWATRHTSGITDRLKEAQRAITLGNTYYDQLEVVSNTLLMRKLGTDGTPSWPTFMERLVPLPVDAKPQDRTWLNRQELRNAITAVWRNSDNLGNVRGTAWGALQAVAEYEDHHRPVRAGRAANAGERRFIRATTEPGIKQQALHLLAPDLASTKANTLALLQQRNGN